MIISVILLGFEPWQVERDEIIDCPSGVVRIYWVQICYVDCS
jgi:hypothetical protein